MDSSKSYKKSQRTADPTRALQFLSPIHKATRQVSIFLERQTRRLGVSNTEAHLLTFLRSYGPCPIGDLLRVFGLKKSTMTSLLDRLVRRGLVSRETYAEDRRSFVIALTRAGKTTADEVRRLLEELEQRIAGRIRRQDLAGFEAVMNAIAAVTKQEDHNSTVSRVRKRQGGNT